MNADEKRGYARCYAAGKRRQADDDQKRSEEMRANMDALRRIDSAQLKRHDAFFCAALTGILARGSWSIGDKKDMPTQVQIAKQFADEAMREVK